MTGVAVLDKPEGMTSHDVVARLRRILGERRIGHGGTLDPIATGVLPILVGRATRASDLIASADKEYVAGLRLGVTTDTMDITGKVINTAPAAGQAELLSALNNFRGTINQLPPMYSAVKVGGKKLYELARKGIEAERETRQITISRLELLDIGGGDFKLLVHCSKGTYIRVLCNDIGQALGCGGTMASLRRLRAGRFNIEDAATLEDFEAAGAALLKPVDAVFSEYPELAIDAASEKACRNGAAFEADAASGLWRVYSRNGEFLMLGRSEDGKMSTEKSFFEI